MEQFAKFLHYISKPCEIPKNRTYYLQGIHLDEIYIFFTFKFDLE